MEKAAVAIGMRDLAAGLGLNEEVIDLQARTLAILTRAEKRDGRGGGVEWHLTTKAMGADDEK